ncbi:MAG: aminopeptidase [Clostridiales bacterium]|nr:aminopeptidase [Clostridiales bacterium]
METESGKTEEFKDLLSERHQLSFERIRQIPQEDLVKEPYRSCFVSMAEFLLLAEQTAEKQRRDDFRFLSLKELGEWNRSLYEDILPEHYDESFANPQYAVRMLGAEHGPLLAAFYAQLRAAVVFAYEGRKEELTILAETLIEIYNRYEGDLPASKSVKDILYWFHSDYADVTIPYRLREQLDPSLTFAKDIIMEEDLSDLRYLYHFGEYISTTQMEIADFLAKQPQEIIDRMAETFVKGYRRGFAVMGRDLSRKRTVAIRYELGFERMVRSAIIRFREMGLEPIIYRAPVWSVSAMPNRRIGYHGASPNRQYDYDHRYDMAVYFDKAFKERRQGILRTAYEEFRELAAQYAGPAVIETFGEEPFRPVLTQDAFSLTKKQEEWLNQDTNETMMLTDHYIPGRETSFTIIAFPVPAIGDHYPGIFDETIRINTLDNERYQQIQQKLIDVLDQGNFVHVTGRGENETDMIVHLHPLQDTEYETNFENCVADVNIPVGEVFTSPVLSGTNGLLHVRSVYLGNILYHDLKLTFTDGRVTDYSCTNFENPQEGRDLIRQEILKNHDFLPLGEFAIGTNTAAYAMAERYGIAGKLPILIAEKMGPHFAVGDTCYSWSEDEPMVNPDGKEVIARDNEISLLRKEDPSRAYFGCHTDITIPYSELGDITAVCADGRELAVIRQGRFAVPGTEELNREL